MNLLDSFVHNHEEFFRFFARGGLIVVGTIFIILVGKFIIEGVNDNER